MEICCWMQRGLAGMLGAAAALACYPVLIFSWTVLRFGVPALVGVDLV
jgi:hypothetical protein